LGASAFALLSAGSALLPVQSVQAQVAKVLEEVVVTARKREESLQETPVAVSVLTENMVNSNQIQGIADLGTIVPGLVTAESTAATGGTIYLRGVGTGGGNALFDQAVAINLDGVGISSAQLMSTGMFDLQRIEVLRGPQALFFGKNSPGGVIALHTKDPTDAFEAQLTAEYETETEEPALRGIVSGPLTETLSGRLSMGWSNADKYLFDVYNFDEFETGPNGEPVQTAFATGKNPVEIEHKYAMGTLLWEPTDNFTGKLKYAYLKKEQDGSAMFSATRTQCAYGDPQVLYPVPGIDNCKAGEDIIAPGTNPALVARDQLYPNYRGDEGGFVHSEDHFAVLEMNYDLGNDLNVTSVTGYFENENKRLGDSSWQVASGLVSSGYFHLEQWSQELRLSSDYAGPVNFTLGAYYEDKQLGSKQGVVFGSNLAGLPVSVFGEFGIPGGTQINSQDSSAYSVFGQVIWDLTEKWTLSGGARYSYEEKEPGIIAEVGAAPEIGQPAVPPTNILLKDDNPDWNNVSPELTLSYQFSDDIMFFTSYRTGFKSGGVDGSFNVSTVLPLTAAGIPYDNLYDEEKVEGFEVGMKSTLLDGTLRFNVTAYSYDYDDMQLSKLTAGSGGLPSLQVINAAGASLEGVEVETFWLTPVDGLTLTANLAWANSEYDDYIADCYVGQTIAMGCDVNPDPVTGNFTGADMSGESLPNASDLSATLGVDYQVAVANNWNLGFNVTTAYKDDYNATAMLYPDSYRQDSYWWTNAAVSLFSSDDKWEFFARGINLGDVQYVTEGSNTIPGGNEATTGTNDPSGLSDFWQFVNGGRQFTLGVTYRM